MHFSMAFCHLPRFLCTTKILFSFVGSQQSVQEQRQWETHTFPSFQKLIVACSGKKSRANKKVKVTNPIKSNVDLCNELKEFMLAAGFPENHVPSMKDLHHHGRKDLANIVRRRGYKLIKELLMNATELETDLGKNIAESQDDSSGYRNDSAEAQDKRINGLVVDLSSSTSTSTVENYFPETSGIVPVYLDVPTDEKIEPSICSSLHKKAAIFVQNGYLEMAVGLLEVEDVSMHVASNIGYDSSRTIAFEASQIDAVLDNEMRVESMGFGQKSLSFEIESNVDSNLSASAVSSKEVSLLAKVHTSQRDNIVSNEGLNRMVFDKELLNEAGGGDDQNDIDCLKALLHEKELELSQLKQQIEEEKRALSNLQRKAKTEIGNAQKVISTKDAELLAAEGNLYGLKEVRIEYWDACEMVEVAGSFNGWHHQINMDLHVSAETTNQDRLRKSVLWSTVLWLYPGIYEIKFIVDGNWKIDSQREFITRGNIQNNILRVDR